MRWWGCELISWWVCEVMSLWGDEFVSWWVGGLMSWRVDEWMRWWVCELISWRVGEVMSLWIDDFFELMYSGVVWAFMSLSASELFLPCTSYMSGVFILCCITKTTNSFQLIETLKAKTASTWEHPFRVSSKIKIYIYIFYNSTSFLVLPLNG